MFRGSSCPSSRATTIAAAASGLPLERGGSSAVDHIMSGYDEVHSFHTWFQLFLLFLILLFILNILKTFLIVVFLIWFLDVTRAQQHF
jgi:hypothetical protein